jgi:hypothetical protein
MAIPHAKPGEVVDVRPLGSALASAQTKTLVRAEQVEVIRLVVPAAKEIEEHKAKGEITVHAWKGRSPSPLSARRRTSRRASCSTCPRGKRTRSRGSRTPRSC